MTVLWVCIADAPERYHAIDRVTLHATTILCRGSFSNDSEATFSESPPAELRCDYCETVAAARAPVEKGLRELVANALPAPVVGSEPFDGQRACAPHGIAQEPALTTPAQWREAFDAIDRRFDRSDRETEIVDVDGFECGGEA